MFDCIRKSCLPGKAPPGTVIGRCSRTQPHRARPIYVLGEQNSPVLSPNAVFCADGVALAATRRRLAGCAACSRHSYPAVKHFLESAGFHVKGEVNGCDAVAVEDGEPQRLAIVEMKRGFSLDLLLQAVER